MRVSLESMQIRTRSLHNIQFAAITIVRRQSAVHTIIFNPHAVTNFYFPKQCCYRLIPLNGALLITSPSCRNSVVPDRRQQTIQLAQLQSRETPTKKLRISWKYWIKLRQPYESPLHQVPMTWSISGQCLSCYLPFRKSPQKSNKEITVLRNGRVWRNSCLDFIRPFDIFRLPTVMLLWYILLAIHPYTYIFSNFTNCSFEIRWNSWKIYYNA